MLPGSWRLHSRVPAEPTPDACQLATSTSLHRVPVPFPYHPNRDVPQDFNFLATVVFSNPDIVEVLENNQPHIRAQQGVQISLVGEKSVPGADMNIAPCQKEPPEM